MTQKVDMKRVEALNPFPDPPNEPEAAERLLRELLAKPAAPPRRRRPPVVRVAVGTATVAAAAAAAIALWPTSGSSPNVIGNAVAALTKPDTILHFKTHGNHEPPGEEWHTSDGRLSRVVTYAHGVTLESTLDYDKGVWDSYVPARNEIDRYAPPGFLNHGPQKVDAGVGTIDDYGDLEALLERARGGQGNVHLDGEATIRGIKTDVVRIGATRTVYISKADHLPVRLVENVPGGDSVTDYLDVEQLPRTPANERLLQMSPHPGATVRDVSGM